MQYKGVNLGGWLVLERWITPSLFEGIEAQDEYTLCKELGSRSLEVLKKHRKNFITEADIIWLKQNGINTVRIPVPHWVFGNFSPFMPCASYLDWIMDIALQKNMNVLIDLHTAPGSQNGNDHSGCKGSVNWHKEPGSITRTLDIVEKLAERYCKYPNLIGISLLNEPSRSIPKSILLDYYHLGYKRIRRYCDESVAVVINDTFDPKKWKHVMTESQYKNVWLDTHLYQVFSRKDKKSDMTGVLKKAKNEWSDLLSGIQRTRPVIVGEWSLGLDANALRVFDSDEKDRALQAYGDAQIEAYSNAVGHFFWTYKTETMAGWSFRDAVKRGWLNPTFYKE